MYSLPVIVIEKHLELYAFERYVSSSTPLLTNLEKPLDRCFDINTTGKDTFDSSSIQQIAAKRQPIAVDKRKGMGH